MGRQAEDIVAQGGLLPDELMLKVVTTKLDQLHNKVCSVALYYIVASLILFIHCEALDT